MALVCSVAGQELGTNVFSSEDELIEAFAAGELGLAEYLALREMLWLGVDSTTVGTLDFVPNVAS